MNYTKWNISKMNEQLAILRKLYRHTRDDSLRYDIALLTEAKERKINPFEYTGSFYSEFIEDVYALQDNASFIDDIAKFGKLYPLLRRELIDYEDEYKISPKEILEFTHDFYKGIDPELAKIFFRVYKERKDNLKFTKDRGISFTIDKLNYSYISVSKQDVVADYINSIHEYAHTIADRLYYRTNYAAGYPFIELMPLLMELIACDKMIELFENVSKDVIGYKASELDGQIKSSLQVDLMARYLNKVSEGNGIIPGKKKAIIADMMNKLNIGRKEVLDFLDVTTLERLSYLIPYMTAIEFYYLYKKDPEKAIHYLKEIITLPYAEDYNVVLLDRGINLNEHSKKLTLEINDDLKNFRH